jgi:hypothetical protein
VLTHWNNGPRIDISPHLDTLSWFRANQSFETSTLTITPPIRFNKSKGLKLAFNTNQIIKQSRGRHGRDHIFVCMYIYIYTTTCGISVHHHYSCEFKSPHARGVLDTTVCDKVCQWAATDRWFSLGTLVSSINKTYRQDITEIVLKVALNTKTYNLHLIRNIFFQGENFERTVYRLWCNDIS